MTHPFSTSRLQRLLAISIACSALAALPGVVAADEPQVVRMATCYYGNDGQATVAPGDVTVEAGWGATTKGLVNAFVKGIDTSATIGGVEVANVESYWGPPIQQAKKSWRADWNYEAGSLAPGQTLSVHFVMTLRHPLVDGDYREEGHNNLFVFPAGSTWDMTCEITATLE